MYLFSFERACFYPHTLLLLKELLFNYLFMGLFGKKCLKCGSSKINVLKEGFMNDLKRSMLNVAFPIRFFLASGKKPKNLNVCKDCGFSWEDR